MIYVMVLLWWIWDFRATEGVATEGVATEGVATEGLNAVWAVFAIVRQSVCVRFSPTNVSLVVGRVDW